MQDFFKVTIFEWKMVFRKKALIYVTWVERFTKNNYFEIKKAKIALLLFKMSKSG